jgi:hypothetical protein
MIPFIQIIRRPYEEPYHLNLVVTASNENVRSSLEFYLNANSLVEWADAMETFPKHQSSVFLSELGSERPEDRFAFYFRLRLFTVNARGHCAIQFRFNNNAALPEREISEFCILAEAAQVNRLGSLCREFAKLRHAVLRWSLTDGNLYDTIQEAEQSAPEDAFRATRL